MFYKSILAQPAKIIITRNEELVKVVVGNLHPVITNRVNIMNSVLKVSNKYLDEITVPFRQIL